jgi:hypothetical protein
MKKWLEYSDNLMKLGQSVGGVFTLMELSLQKKSYRSAREIIYIVYDDVYS